MGSTTTKKVVSFLVLFCLLLNASVFAAPTTFNATGSWSDPTKWSAGVPGIGDAATIASGVICTITAAGAQCASLTFAANNAADILLTMNTGTDLTVAGAVTYNNTSNKYQTLAVNDASLTCASMTFANTSGAAERLSLTISTGIVIVTGNITTNGSAASENYITFTGAGTGTIKTGGTFGTNAFTFTELTGTIEYTSAGAVDITDETYYNLICSGAGTKTDNNGVTVGGNLTISNGTYLLSGNNTCTVTGSIIMTGGTLDGDNANGIFNAAAFDITDGSTINGSQSFDINVGTFACNQDVGADPAVVSSIGRCDLTMTGATVIDGDFTFALSGSGTKSFRAVTISATGKWDNAIGESPRMNGNIINNGSWIGCTTGACDYSFGRTAVGSYTVSGNPVSVSRISIQDATTVTNLGIIIIDGNNDQSAIRNRSGSGNAIFNNGDGVTPAVLYLQNVETSNNGVAVELLAPDLLTFNASFANNTVHYSYAGNQLIRTPDDGSYYNLVFSNSGTKSFQTSGGTITTDNLLTIQDAAICVVGATENLDGAGGLTMTGTSDLQIATCTLPNVPELTGTYSLTGGTITLNGTCGQTWNSVPTGANTCNNLVLSGSGAKCIGGLTTINGDITISGSATMTCNSTFTMDCSKTFTYNSTGNTILAAGINIGSFSHTNTGDFSDGTFTITVCGSSFSKIAPSLTADFVPTGRVIFNPSSGSCSVTSTAAANIFQFKNVTINPSKTLVGDVNGMNIGNGGGADWTNNGTFTHNSGTVTVIGNTSVLGTAVTSFYNLTINNTFTLTGHATNMNIEKNWTNSNAAGGYTHNNGTVTFTAGNAQTITKAGTETFYNLVINKTAATTVTSAVTTIAVTNLLTMTEGIFDINTNTLNGTGNFTATGGDLQIAKTPGTVPELSGTYAITGGTVTLDGAGDQTLNTSPAGGGGSTYYNLVFGTSGIKTITGLTVINGDVTVSGLATLFSFSAFTQASAKTFNYSSTSTTTVTAGVPIIVGNYNQTSTAGGMTLPANAANTMTVRGTTWVKSGAGTFTNTTPSRVVFNGSSGQTFTDNGTVFSNVTIDNGSGVTLSNDMSISVDLTFSNGTIVTGTNNVVLTATTPTTVTGAATGKFVDGNLKKNIIADLSTRTFEVGKGTDYTPVDITFPAGTTSNYFTVSASSGDNPNIYASTINPSKTVNRYWTFTNNGLTIGGAGLTATFNFLAGDVDPGCDVLNNVIVQSYSSSIWNAMNVPTRAATSTTVAGIATPLSGNTESYQIGEDYNAFSVWNRVSNGTYNWNSATTWIQDRTGTISTNGGVNDTVTGIGTFFNTELELLGGDIIMLQSLPGTTYTVDHVIDDTHLILTAAANIPSGSYGKEHVPDANDYVNIGNDYANAGNTTITVDAPGGSARRITFITTTTSRNNTLQHNAGQALSVGTSVIIKQPNAASTHLWNINAGSATVSGNLMIGYGDNTATHIAKVTVNTGGTLNINTNLVYTTTAAAAAVLDLTAGTGRVNLAGALTLTSAGTLSTAGTENIFNYNGTTSGQTVNLSSATIVYRNLYLNNTSTGATLGAAVSAAKVTGDIIVQNGTLFNGGFAIAGAARKLEVDNSASLKLTGTPANPTISGFTTHDFQASSHVYFQQGNTQTVLLPSNGNYGNLYIQPAGTFTHTMAASTFNVLGNLTIGDGTNTGTLAGTATTTLNVTGNITISANGILNITNINTACGGDWTNNGGTLTTGTRTVTFNGSGAEAINGTATSQTFYNIAVSKSAGTTLSCGGSTTTLNTNNITVNTGNFTAPATLNLNSTATATMTLAGGTFTAGALTTIRGDWTNNGGTFTPNGGLVSFTAGGGVAQVIGGTAVSQTFFNLEANSAATSSIRIGGSTTTLTMNNYTQTVGSFGSNNNPVTVNVNGNFTLTDNSYNSVGTSGAITALNIGGNVTYNSTVAWVMSTTVTLNGTTAQTISGTQTIPTFTNLTINNTYPATGVTLSKPVNVDGLFTLTDGHLVTDATNIITLNDLATVSGGGDSSFVKGPMAYLETTDGVAATKVFPIGKENLMHKIELNITHSSTGTNTYTATYYLASDAEFAATSAWTLPGTVDRVSAIGHWDLSQSGAASIASGSVKLYYLASDRVADAPNLCVVKGNPSAWITLEGTGSAAPSGFITSVTNFTTFSRFGLGNRTGGLNPLPVELLSFDATVVNNEVVDLKWSTATEINNDYFTIERTGDGISFETIATVNGAGNSTAILNYKTTDENPLAGNSYYRLKQTDFDGKFKYTNLVTVTLVKSNEFNFNVFPNPSSGDNTQISISGGGEGKAVLLVVYGVDGKEEFSKVIVLSGSGQHIIAIDPSKKLAQGVYFITATSNQTLYQKKLIIE